MSRLEELTNRNEDLQGQLDEAEDEMEQLMSKMKTLETDNVKKSMEIKEHSVSLGARDLWVKITRKAAK